jgi:hypothetical protein
MKQLWEVYEMSREEMNRLFMERCQFLKELNNFTESKFKQTLDWN